MSAYPAIWVEAREDCLACKGSGEGGPQGPQDGAKETKRPGVLICQACRGEGFLPVSVELSGLASGHLRVSRVA